MGDGRLIVYKQNACLAWRDRVVKIGVYRVKLRHMRPIQGKDCALTDRAFNRDRAIVFGHDAMDDRQTHTGALALRFAGIKRLKNAL